jgi:multiple sugar transport system ATP-binding protein
MASIELDSVSKVFDGDVIAVDDVSLTIADGEFMVLVGPSGCGKSTLLRLIAGLEETSAGSVSIGGRDVTDLAPRHRDVAMVFQSYALYPHMTVRQNLGYGLKVRRTAKAEIARRVDHVAALLDLTPLLGRRPAQLSGGQRQRVAMGRAIVREPQAFLMDEPLSNLDAKLRVGMRSSLAQLHARLGVTTVYVTHDQTEAMTLGQRVAVMRAGAVVQVADPQALYREPADLFVAAFIGSPPMNLVEAAIDGDDVVFGRHRLALGPTWRPSEPVREVVLGIRPEAFERAAGSAASEPVVAGSVEVVEEFGADAYVFFRVDAPPVLADPGVPTQGDALLAEPGTLFAARVGPSPPERVGDPVHLTVDPSLLHFFDPVTGKRLRTRGAAPALEPDEVVPQVVLTNGE